MAVVASSSSADYPCVAKELELAAERLELKIQLLDITKLDLQTAFRDAVSAGSGRPVQGAWPGSKPAPNRDCSGRAKEPASGDL